MEIHHQRDLPARAGIGSSSSFAVDLIKALKALRGETIDRECLALLAIKLEQECLKGERRLAGSRGCLPTAAST